MSNADPQRRARRLRAIAQRQLVYDEELTDRKWLEQQGYLRVSHWPSICFIITEAGFAWLREQAGLEV